MKSTLLSSLFFGLLLLLSSNVVHAEGNCPPGYYPIGAPPGQQGPQSCAPIPEYINNQQQAQPPPPQWASRWGAIVTDSVKGSLGAVTGLPSKGDAQRTALTDCANKGGLACNIDVVYGNECAVMVVGKSGYNFAADASMDKATESAMQTCSAADTNCHVYYSDCSLPIRIQ